MLKQTVRHTTQNIILKRKIFSSFLLFISYFMATYHRCNGKQVHPKDKSSSGVTDLYWVSHSYGIVPV